MWDEITYPFPNFNGPIVYNFVYASVNLVIIGLGKGLSPFERQVITWANTDL